MSDVLASAYGGITGLLGQLDEGQLLRPTRCEGWTVADLTFHLLLDAQRALVTFASPADDAADVDAATYWAPHKPGAPWAAGHAAYVRASAAAYSEPRGVVRHWSDTAAAAVRASAAAAPDAVLATQGHVLTAADFVSTLVMEAVVHHLDFLVTLPDAPLPAGDVLAHVRDVLDRMSGASAPREWPTADYVLVASGRIALPDGWRARLGDAAAKFPLLG